jgi:two-component system, OmpR family, KDP operon response regulator KdpE
MADKPVVLVIEDDSTISNFIRVALTAREYACLEAPTGRAGLVLLTARQPDVVLLDLGLPDIDGMEVLREIRSFSQVPVIVVTARGQENEKAQTLDSGADDYLCKPFSMVELLARIRVALRHSQQAKGSAEAPRYAVGGLDIDFGKRRVTLDGNEVHLTPNEYKMLALLARNAGRVLTHSYLAKELWGVAMEKDANSLRVFMTGIRHKLELDPAHPRYLKTEIGVGYRLMDE